MGTEGQAVAGGKERPDQDQNQGSFYRFLLPFAEQFLIINTDLTSNFQYSCKQQFSVQADVTSNF